MLEGQSRAEYIHKISHRLSTYNDIKITDITNRIIEVKAPCSTLN